MRINLYGGPGCGKSRTAARLFSEGKNILESNYTSIELVQEYIKSWAFSNQHPIGYDQLHIFSEQLRREELLLRNGVGYIITDCPVPLCAMYAKYDNLPYWKELYDIAKHYNDKYESINIILNRPEKYVNNGRFHSLDKAIDLDGFIQREVLFFTNVFLLSTNDITLEAILDYADLFKK